MSQITGKFYTWLAALALAAVGCVFTGQAFAQQKTVEQKQTGPTEFKVDTRNTTVAYVEGNHLVVRQADGSLEAIRIPAGESFMIDGEKLSLQELKPGMILTEEVYTTTKPILVKTVEISDGTIWHVSSNRLTIRTRDNQIVEYNIPDWATINIKGVEESMQDLRRGQQITATIITEEPMTVSEREVRAHGHYGTAERKKTATEIRHMPELAPVTPAHEVAQSAPPAELQAAAETEEKLPETASPLPLLGLLGLLGIAMSLSLRAYRKSI